MSKGGAFGSVVRVVVRSETLLVTLAILLASLLSFVVATHIYYSWPEKLVMHSSLIAFSFFILFGGLVGSSISCCACSFANFIFLPTVKNENYEN